MIPTQETVNWNDPKEHFSWALKNMPTFAGTGAVTHPGFLVGWSEHLWKAGFAHRDYLAGLADENGMIHVSKLPAQTIKWQPASRGPRNNYNNAARWVDMSAHTPEPMRIQDLRQLTIQEQHAAKDMLIETGVVKPDKPQQHQASVEN